MTDFEDDEIITVKLPRKDYQALRDIIERENAYNWLKNSIRSFWVWALVGGIITVLTLADRVKDYLVGTVK